MIWILLAAVLSLIWFIISFIMVNVYKKTSSNWYPGLIVTAIIPLMLGLFATLIMGTTDSSTVAKNAAWHVKSITAYPLRISPQVHVIELNEYRHQVTVVDTKRDGKDHTYIIEDLPIKVLDTVGVQTLVLKEYEVNPANHWVYQAILRTRGNTLTAEILVE